MKTTDNRTLVLSSLDVQSVVRHVGVDHLMDALIERLERALESFDSDWIDIPARAGFHYDAPEAGLIEWMPLYSRGEHVMLKVVGYHPSNPQRLQVPTILSSITAYDTSTGHLSVVMDGVIPTAFRTGAASAVASRVMADPRSKTLGLIGCGAQAVSQFHALSRVFDFHKVRIFDIDRESVDSFGDRVSGLQIDVEIEPNSISEIVAKSDIVCTATSIDIDAGPLFNALPTQEKIHINAVGSDFPGKVELPVELLKNSFVCPDFFDQAIKEGECQQLAETDIGADFAKVMAEPERFHHLREERSVFDSTGWALEDRVVMDLFLEYAMELELGRWIAIETMSEDSKNPYQFLLDQNISVEVIDPETSTI